MRLKRRSRSRMCYFESLIRCRSAANASITVAEQPFRRAQVGWSSNPNSNTLARSQGPNEANNAEARKRTLTLPESAFGGKKVKIEEPDEENESPSFHVPGAANKDEEAENVAIIKTFKSYEDIYKSAGKWHLTDEYAHAVDKVLKVSVDHPIGFGFRWFSVTPAFPPFILQDQKGRALLKKKLLTYTRYLQCRKRALHIIDLAVPRLKELRNRGMNFTDGNMIPIFRDLLNDSRWSSNAPRPSYICECATPEVLAKAFGCEVKELGGAPGLRKDNLPYKLKRSDWASPGPNAATKAGDVPRLEESVTEQAHQGAHSGFVSVDYGHIISLMSSPGSLPQQPVQLPIEKGLCDAVFEDQGQSNLGEQILAKIDRISDVSYDKSLANLRRQRSIRRLNEMLKTTSDLPLDEQLTLINRTITE